MESFGTGERALPSTSNPEDRILGTRAVIDKTSFSRTSLWRLSRQGAFPAPIKLSTGRIGWSRNAIDAWLADRTREAA